jgi:hypothetical protein
VLWARGSSDSRCGPGALTAPPKPSCALLTARCRVVPRPLRLALIPASAKRADGTNFELAVARGEEAPQGLVSADIKVGWAEGGGASARGKGAHA